MTFYRFPPWSSPVVPAITCAPVPVVPALAAGGSCHGIISCTVIGSTLISAVLADECAEISYDER